MIPEQQEDKLISFGKMALEQGWYEQARDYFEQALALDADNREAMKWLARVNEILSRREVTAAPRIRARPEVPSEAPAKPPPEPMVTPKTRLISIDLRELTLGRKVSVSGALLALFCFFLPWIELSCSGMRVTSVSGMDMATRSSQADSAGWMLFLVPLAALSVLVTIYLALGISTLRAHVSAAFEFIAALVGLVVTSRVYFVIQDAMQDAIQDARNSSDLTFLALLIPDPEFFLRFVYGYWGTLAGFVAVIVGALLDWKESQSKPRDKTMHVLTGRDRTMYVLAGIVLLAVVLTVAWAMSVGTTPKGLENWLSLAPTPTPISAEAQEPTHGANVVIVEWTTEAEVDVAGFNLYRSESPDGPYVKVNTTLIPGGSDSLLGGKYSYTDTNVVVGHTYYYKLEDVELDGTTTLHGPIEVVVEKWSMPTRTLGMSRVNPAPVGQPVVADNNIQLTVLGLERNAWTKIHEMSSFYPEPQEGVEYVIVTLRARNLGDPAESQTITWLNFDAVGERGIVYHPPFFVLSEKPLAATLFGGGTTEGQLCFEVGQGEKELVLIYDPSLGIGTTARYLSLGQ